MNLEAPPRSLLLAGLEHEEAFVRDALLSLLSHAHDPGTDATHAVQRQVRARGWEAAYSHPYSMTSLALDPAASDWVLEALERGELPGSLLSPADHLCGWVLEAAPWGVLEPRLERLRALGERHGVDFNRQGWKRIPWRAAAQSMGDSARMRRLLELAAACHESEGNHFPHDLVAEAEEIAASVSGSGDPEAWRRVIGTWMQGDWGPEREAKPEDWLAGFAIIIAGHLPAPEATSTMVRMMAMDWDWWSEGVQRALFRMRDCGAVEQVIGLYPEQEWHVRLYLSFVLQGLRFAGLEGAIIRLLEGEEAHDLRGTLAQALAAYGTPESMARARGVWESDLEDREYEVIGELLTSVRVLRGEAAEGEVKAQRDAWTRHRERMKRGEALRGWGQEAGELPWFSETEASLPVVREAPKVGRNDPCPCGSGKKYKKCCLAAGG